MGRSDTNAFVRHLDDIYPISRLAIDETMRIRRALGIVGSPIGPNWPQ